MRYLAIYYLIGCICLFYSTLAIAQVPRLSITASRDHITIGDTLTLHIRSEYNVALRQDLGNIADTLGVFEVLSRTDPNIKSKDGNQIFAQDFILIAFDSGNALIPPFKVAYINQETGATNSIATTPIPVRIDSVAVDMQQNAKDIKPPIEMPLTWRDYLPYALTFIAVAVAVVCFIAYRRRKKAVPPTLVLPEVPPRPPHEIALTQLQALAQARYWQQGNIKQYYSELSDIMRRYIAQTYSINATEQTTDETIADLQQVGNNKTSSTLSAVPELQKQETVPIQTTPPNPQQIAHLRNLLQTSDMVKFAKAIPDIDTHTRLLETAERWVRDTKNAVG